MNKYLVWVNIILIIFLVTLFFIDQDIDKSIKDYNKEYKSHISKALNESEKDFISFHQELENEYKVYEKKMNKIFQAIKRNINDRYSENVNFYKEQLSMHKEHYHRSIHKFLENIFNYNPYLTKEQVFSELAKYYDMSFANLSYKILNDYNIDANKIIIKEHKSYSKLNDNRILVVQLQFQIKKMEKKEIDISLPKLKLNLGQQKTSTHNIDYKNKWTLLSTEEEKIVYWSIIGLLTLLIIQLITLQQKFFRSKENFNRSIANKTKLDINLELNKLQSKILIENYNLLLTTSSQNIKETSDLKLKQNQFIADSVHQLKTPLSSIMMNMNLIEMYEDSQKKEQFISQMRSSIDMLNLTYEELSYLSMHSVINYNKEYLNLSLLLNNKMDFFKSIANNYDKKLMWSIERSIFYTISKIEFERIIDNNVINAIKYAKVNSSIKVTLLKKDDNIFELTFISQGKEIRNPDEIFNRHYREEESVRGHGLGLAITKEICKKYHIKHLYKRENISNIFIYTFEI